MDHYFPGLAHGAPAGTMRHSTKTRQIHWLYAESERAKARSPKPTLEGRVSAVGRSVGCRAMTAICAKETAGVDVRERVTGESEGPGLFQGGGVPALGEGADQRGKHQRPNVTPFCAEANLATAHVGVKQAKHSRNSTPFFSAGECNVRPEPPLRAAYIRKRRARPRRPPDRPHDRGSRLFNGRAEAQRGGAGHSGQGSEVADRRHHHRAR